MFLKGEILSIFEKISARPSEQGVRFQGFLDTFKKLHGHFLTNHETKLWHICGHQNATRFPGETGPRAVQIQDYGL